MQIIQHTELGSAQSSIVFNSIPQTFTDLLVVFSLRNEANSVDADFTFNNQTANRSTRRLYGGGSGSGASDTTSDLRYVIPPSSATALTFGNGSIYIPNYTSSNAKSASSDSVTEFNNPAAFQHLAAHLWNDSSPITSIQLRSSGGSTLSAFSSATLYGILKGSSGGVTVS